ncbi:MAG TPA: hypothetical protein VGF28_09425 [Thermoanaerobaculia bacterium]|jgi:hypothetical protein
MTEPETIPKSRFVWPADHYSAPTPPSAFPPAVTYGCGIAAAVALLLIFAGGIFLSSGGFTTFLDFSISMSVAEMKGMYAKEVAEPRRKSLEREIETMRENLRAERISIVHLQPFLESLRSAGYDKEVTEQEARALEETARKINGKSQSRKVSKSQR